MDFTVKTAQFEGPLDLLLSLIEERRLLVSDVSLAEVADAFLTYLTRKESFPVAEAAHFIVVASTLLLLKSRSLLPVLELSDEEEGDIHDLKRRLMLLESIRRAAKDLALFNARMFFGAGVDAKDPLFAPAPDMSLDRLQSAMCAALAQAPTTPTAEEVSVAHVVSLDEMIDHMTERVQHAITLSFKDFSRGATDPREVVVGFLAMLELVKRGFAQVKQASHFEDITIEYAGSSDTPRYE